MDRNTKKNKGANAKTVAKRKTAKDKENKRLEKYKADMAIGGNNPHNRDNPSYRGRVVNTGGRRKEVRDEPADPTSIIRNKLTAKYPRGTESQDHSQLSARELRKLKAKEGKQKRELIQKYSDPVAYARKKEKERLTAKDKNKKDEYSGLKKNIRKKKKKNSDAGESDNGSVVYTGDGDNDSLVFTE